MADGTKIEWTDATWNVVNGCSVLSPGCTNCYAMRLAGTRLRNHPSRAGLARMVNGNPVWTGEVRFNDKVLLDPLRWRRPRRIFVCAHGDLFHDEVPDDWIDKVFAVMALARHHQFQLLTKRAARMQAYVDRQARGLRQVSDHVDIWQNQDAIPKHINSFRDWIGQPDNPRPLPNVWLGVSVEDQARADERIPHLLATPAAVRWLSCEPLLGPVDLSSFFSPGSKYHFDPNHHWVVAGGESGPGARPMHPDWARSLRDQCAAAGVPFLFKQWGEWGQDNGPPIAGRDVIFEGSARAAVWRDSSWTYLDNGFQGPVEWCERPDDWLFKLGKKAAGRRLDSHLHDGFPA